MSNPETALSFVKVARFERPLGIWEESFGPYPWFFAPFVGEFIRQSQITTHDLYKFYVDNRNTLEEELSNMVFWSKSVGISAVQIKNVVANRLVRLDKALLTIKISLKLEEIKQKHTKYGILKDMNRLGLEKIIIPSTFVLDNTNSISKDSYEKLSESIKQSRSLVADVMRGAAVVEVIAEDIRMAVEKLGIGSLEVRMLDERRDRHRGSWLTPSSYQQINLRQVREYYSESNA